MSKHIPLSQYLMDAHLSQVMTVEGLSWIIINLLRSLLQIVTSSMAATISNNNNVNINNQNISYPIRYKDQTQQPANHKSILKFKKRIHCLANPQDQQVRIWQTDYPSVADNLVLANFLTNLTNPKIKSIIYVCTSSNLLIFDQVKIFHRTRWRFGAIESSQSESGMLTWICKLIWVQSKHIARSPGSFFVSVLEAT